MFIKRIHLMRLLFPLIALLAIASSCRDKNYFDKENYQRITHGIYPVDTLDESHDWNLIRSSVVQVTTNGGLSDVSSVQILSGNPYSGLVEVLGSKKAGPGEKVRFTIDFPITQETLYAAAVTSSGKYYVKEFSVDKHEVQFADGGIIGNGDFVAPANQKITYLFEESFPEPTDFDFNDVVLRISKSAPETNLLCLTVTLAAAGASKPIAGAIRLRNVDYSQVEEVTIAEEQRMDDDYPMMRTKLRSDFNLSEGSYGEAVINLFEDAHWSLGHEKDDIGIIKTLKYNTMHYAKEDVSAIVQQQTRTYNIRLKEGVDATMLSMSSLDPFIITPYNGVNFEIHTHQFKFSEVLWSYLGKDKTAYDDHLAWALAIPDPLFRYPIEEMPLGTYRNGEIFGAYGKYMHSFGEWGRNQYAATDWWQYPSSSMGY